MSNKDKYVFNLVNKIFLKILIIYTSDVKLNPYEFNFNLLLIIWNAKWVQANLSELGKKCALYFKRG